MSLPFAIVCVDLDDTLSEFMNQCIAEYNKTHGTSLTIKDFKGWDVNQVTDPDKPFTTMFGHEHVVENANVVYNAQLMLENIIRLGYGVKVVTAAQYCQRKRIEWLKKHFDFLPPKSIVFSEDKNLFGDLLIDDGPHNLKAFTRGHSICFDRPWNHDYTGHRARNWSQVFSYLESFKTNKELGLEVIQNNGNQ